MGVTVIVEDGSEAVRSHSHSHSHSSNSLGRNTLGPLDECGGEDDVRIPRVDSMDYYASSKYQITERDGASSRIGKEWMSAMGRVEVLLLEEADEKRFQIVCLPSENVQASDYMKDTFHLEDPDELPPNMFEQIANLFMDSCAGDTSCAVPIRSALRNKQRKSSKQAPALGLSRSVTFDKVDIHSFGMTLGDHPSAVTGPPVALDWDNKSSTSCFALDDYERFRGERRDRRELKLSMKTRCGILQKEANISAREISQAWEEAMVVRRQRRETLKGGLAQMAYDDFWESANRKLHRATSTLSDMIL